MKNIQESIRHNEELLALKQEEKTSIEQKYSEDILRYRQLSASN
jgi:hypothetical protein